MDSGIISVAKIVRNTSGGKVQYRVKNKDILELGKSLQYKEVCMENSTLSNKNNPSMVELFCSAMIVAIAGRSYEMQNYHPSSVSDFLVPFQD